MTAFMSKSIIIPKLISFLLVLVTILMPFAPDGLRLTVAEPVTTSTDTITVVCKNKTNREISFTPDYYLEKKTENGWEKAEFSQGYGVNEISIILAPMLEYTFTVDTTDLAAPLSQGTYRLAKPFNCRAAEKCVAYTEFIVS